jgi:hypothetical protein
MFSDGASIITADGLGVPQQGKNPAPTTTSTAAATAAVTGTPKQKAAGGPQLNTFQKILKGISGELVVESRCLNCNGEDAIFAWNTVSVLQHENKELKNRVEELEFAVDGALDLVKGVGI